MKYLPLSAMTLVLIGGFAISSAALAAGASDRSITHEVKSQIADSIHFTNETHPKDAVSVSTSNDQVSLSGFVDTAGQKEKADEIATDVPGVQAVRNQLVVNHVKRGGHT